MHLQANLLALEYERADVREEKVAGCITFPFQYSKGKNAWGGVRWGGLQKST